MMTVALYFRQTNIIASKLRIVLVFYFFVLVPLDKWGTVYPLVSHKSLIICRPHPVQIESILDWVLSD